MGQDNGGRIVNSFTDVSDFKDKISEKLIVSRNCDNTGLGTCWASVAKFLNGSPISNWATFLFNTDPSILLQDGIAIHFDYTNGDTNCKSNWNGESETSDVCLVIMVDTNGLKLPNTMGKDIYRFFLNKKGNLVPFGASSSDTAYNPTTDCIASGTGSGCTALYLYSK